MARVGVRRALPVAVDRVARSIVRSGSSRRASRPSVVAEALELRRLFSRAEGVDVSSATGAIDWPGVADDGYAFVYARATEGTTLVDQALEANVNGPIKTGMVTGVSHVAKPDASANDAANEANYFVQHAGDYMTAGYLRPTVSVDEGAALGKPALSAWISSFCAQVHALAGVKAIVQTSSDYAANYVTTSVASDVDLWIENTAGGHGDARTTGAPPTGAWGQIGEPFDFWRHSASGVVSGISGNVRLSVFKVGLTGLDEFVNDQPGRDKVSLKLDFGPTGASVPVGYTHAGPAAYSPQGTLQMGWSSAGVPSETRTGGGAPDNRYRTHAMPHAAGVARSFEVAVPTGVYRVRVAAGSPDQHGDTQRVTVEGTTAIDRPTTFDQPFASATVTVAVTDGRLTIAGHAAVPNTRILFADVGDASLDENGLQASWNFGKDFSAAVPGYFTDIGNRYGARSNGLTYGWRNAAGTPTYTSRLAFERHAEADQRLDTGIQTASGADLYTWEVEVPDGVYYVKLVAGDAAVTSGTYGYHVEGETNFLSGTAGTGAARWITAERTVQVTDGKLTITNADGATNRTLAYLEITSNAARNRSSVAPPRDVVATAVSSGVVDVRWRDDSDNESSFTVLRRLGANGAETVLGDAHANAGRFEDTTASPGVAYTYRVRSNKSPFVSLPVAAGLLTTPATGTGQVPYNPTRTAWTTGTTIEAEAFDTGGEDVSYNDLSVGNSGGFYRSGNLDVGHNLPSGRYFVGWARIGEWMEYTVNVPTAGTYVLDASVASGDALGGKFDIKVNGLRKSSAVQIPFTGAFSTYQPVTSGTFALAAGANQVLRLTCVVDGASGWAVGDIDWVKLRRVGDLPTAGIEIIGTPSTTFNPSMAVTNVPQTLQLPATVRDFHPNGTNGEYSDFGHANYSSAPWTGIVRPTLGTDRTPTLSPSWPLGQYEVRDAESFSWWYHDTPGKNLTTQLAMPFELVGTSSGTPIYAFDNQSFLPINGRLFGNEDPGGVNGGFTVELHSSFTYNENFASPPVLNFTGDDDVWVFINGKLALDLGGIHPPNSGVITLDRPTVETLGLRDGGTYSFDFFFAERQIGGSTLHLETSLPIFGDYDYRATLTANDFAPDTGVSWTVDEPSGATITPIAGASPLTSQLAWTPRASDFGTTKHFKVRATDGQGNVAIREWDVVVGRGANQPPYPVGGAPVAPGVAVVGQTYNWNAAAGFSDADGNALTFLPSGDQPLPDGMTLSASGTFDWLPSVGQLGPHQVSYTIFDGDGGSASGMFNVTVTDQPQPVMPTVTIAVNPASVNEGASPATPATFTVTLTRPDLLSGPITVPLTVSGTAEAGDYTGTIPPNVTFTPGGPSSVEYEITPAQDADEDDEIVAVTLSDIGNGYALGTPASATLAIDDDESESVDVDIDLDLRSDLDEDGSHDDADALELFETSHVLYLPLTSHHRPMAFALRVDNASPQDDIIFTFNSSKVNLYSTGSRATELMSGVAVPLSTFALDPSGFAIIYVDANTQGSSSGGFSVERAGSGQGAAHFFAGGLGGAPSTYDFSNVKPLSPAGYDPMIWAAYMLSEGSMGPSDAPPPPGGVPVRAAPGSNPWGTLWKNEEKLIITDAGDWALIEVFNNGAMEVVVFSKQKPFGPNTFTPAGSPLYKVKKGPGATQWERVGRHSNMPVQLPTNQSRAAKILEVLNGNIDPGVPFDYNKLHRGLLHNLDFEFAPSNLAQASPGSINRFVKKFAGALAFAGMAGVMANAALANPLAADPEPVFDELEKYHNGDSEEIFVKLELDAYMRDLFLGVPDEVISFASYYIFYVWDLEAARAEGDE